MPKYSKKPVEVDANQWFKNGDHPEDKSKGFWGGAKKQDWIEPDGKIVMRHGMGFIDGEKLCKHCENKMSIHGWISTLEGGHIVCPADWIIEGVKGEFYPCKPDVFKLTYEKIEE